MLYILVISYNFTIILLFFLYIIIILEILKVIKLFNLNKKDLFL